jgi:uncharacterized protein (TIGR04255 family)
MSEQAKQVSHLAVPHAERKQYRRNFIATAVCELRFPTLYELDGPKPPLAFAKAIRKDYPLSDIAQHVKVSSGDLERMSTHQFKSKKGQWTVSLRPSSLSLETKRYESFDDFEARIKALCEAAQTFVDSDFFTRIGIRYVNVLPYDRSEIAQWINPTLVGNLAEGLFGEPTEHAQQVRGTTELGGFLLQHGISKDGEKIGYGLDFDFYAEDVEVKDTMQVVRTLHEREYDLFMWAIGEKAKKALDEEQQRG